MSERRSKPERNGKLSIPMPFEDALRGATNVPADKLAKPNGRPAKKTKKT